MIPWDKLKRGDQVPMTELLAHHEKGDCPHAKHNWHSNTPALCVRNKGHLRQHVAVDFSGVVVETW